MRQRAPSEEAGPVHGGRGAPLPDNGDFFSRLAARFAGREAVDLATTGGRGRHFGADSMAVGGHIFALGIHGELVVKLPEARVRELISQGVGVPFGTGRARPMRSWVAIQTQDPGLWEGLAEDAYAYVRSLGRRESRR